MSSIAEAKNSFWRQAWNESKKSVSIHRKLITYAVLFFLVCCFYPTDLNSYREETPLLTASNYLANSANIPSVAARSMLEEGVYWVENRGRFIATAAQVMLPLLLNDRVGLAQMLYSGLATTAATHFFKHIKNDAYIGQTRVGERPNGGRHNMPSGHSSMAGSALGFIWRRYGAWHLIYLLPILVATMATRVFLSAHTLSAVLAGACLGVVLTYVMTTPKKLAVGID